MCEEKKDNELKWHKKSWVWFAIIGAVVTISTAVAFCCWHSSNASRQERIFDSYNKNIERAHNLLSGARKELLDSLRSNPEVLLADYDTMDRLTRVSERLTEEHTASALLEIEANKIQNQYEALGVWAAIITIVFLIFSFYNLFKSEEQQREAREALKVLHDLETKAQKSSDKITNFDTKAQGKLDEIDESTKKKFQSFEEDSKSKIGELENKMTPLYQKITGILDRVEEIKKENQKDLDETYEKERSKLQNFIKNETQRQNNITGEELKKICTELDSYKRQLEEVNKDIAKIYASIKGEENMEADKTTSDRIETSDTPESISDFIEDKDDELGRSNSEY